MKPNQNLNQSIECLETTLNNLAEELRKLKARKQALEKNAPKSTSNGYLESNGKKKEYVVLEYENSEESTSKKKKKLKKELVENVESDQTTLTNNFGNYEETKDKRLRTVSEISMEDVDTRKSKKKKRKHKNEADDDGNKETLDVNEATRKEKKKSKNISIETTNLETPSIAENPLDNNKKMKNEENIESDQPTLTNNFGNYEETKDKRLRTVSEVSVEDVGIRESKKKKRKHKNEADDDGNKETLDVNEATRKEKKKSKNNSTETTNLETPSFAENSLDDNKKMKNEENIESDQPTLTNNFGNYEETKDKRLRTVSEVSVEDVGIRESKKKKRKHKNEADDDGNKETLDVNEATRKEKKKSKNNSTETTNLETPSFAENSLDDNKKMKNEENIESDQPTLTNNFGNYEETKDKRLRTVSEVSVEDVGTRESKNKKRKHKHEADGDGNTEILDVNEATRKEKKKSKNISVETTNLETPFIAENSLDGDKKKKNEEETENMTNETIDINRKLENHTDHSNNIQSKNVPYNDRFHYNRFPNRRSPPLDLQYSNNFKHYNNQVQYGIFYTNKRQKQHYSKEEKINLKSNLISNVTKLDFKGSNINKIPGYGKTVKRI